MGGLLLGVRKLDLFDELLVDCAVAMSGGLAASDVQRFLREVDTALPPTPVLDPVLKNDQRPEWFGVVGVA